MLRGSGGVIGPASVPQQQALSLMPLLAYANYVMGSSQVGYTVRVESPTVLYIICFLSILVSPVYFLGIEMDALFTYGGSTLGFAPLQPFGVYPRQAYVQSGDGHQSMPGMHRVATPSTTLGRGNLLVPLSAVPQPSHLYGGAYSLGDSAESHPIPPPSLHVGEGSSFPGLVPSDDMVDSESVMGIKPGDSSVVIGSLGIRLMSLLAPGLQSSSFPTPTFINWNS